MKLKKRSPSMAEKILIMMSMLQKNRINQTPVDPTPIEIPRKTMKIQQSNGPHVISPEVLLDTGAQVTCIRDTIVTQQLRVPIPKLEPDLTQVAAANGSLLTVLGALTLEMECFCYKTNCPGTKPVRCLVIKGLSEQVLLSNSHCQQLGLVTIWSDKEEPQLASQVECPRSPC